MLNFSWFRWTKLVEPILYHIITCIRRHLWWRNDEIDKSMILLVAYSLVRKLAVSVVSYLGLIG